MTDNKDLVNPNKIEKQVISTNNVNYLIDKVRGNNIGIKLERTYPGGYSESLSIWDKSGETVKEWKTIDVSKIK
jgi:hypothetical protein